MASRGFFGYDPYDYYYTTPSYNYPYPYYQRHPAAASAAAPAPARARDDARGFFPNPAEMAADVRPCRPRSVSVPVHFVGSDPEPDQGVEARRRGGSSRRVQRKRALGAEEAAVRIQAAARGCVARRMVREVRAVEAEAEGMARKVAAEAEALRGDARGRIAVGEGLMRLLLRLDAVHGAREYRRRVTRRVLALQDAVDALEHKPAAQEEEAAALPEVVEAEKENDDMAVAEQDAEEEEMEMAPEDEHHTEMEEKAEVVEAPEPEAEHGAEMEDKSEIVEAPVVETAAEMEVDAAGERPIGEPAEEAEELVVDGEQPPPQEGEDEGEWEMVTEESAAAAEPVDGSATAAAAAAEARQQEEDKEKEKEKEKKVLQGGDGVETRKVMEMVAALCERSAQQCAVIGALAERVDSLERAVRRVEDAERRRRRSKKLKKEGKGNNAKTIDPSCYSD